MENVMLPRMVVDRIVCRRLPDGGITAPRVSFRLIESFDPIYANAPLEIVPVSERIAQIVKRGMN